MKKNNKKASKKAQNFVNILDVNVTSSPVDQVLAGVEEQISHSNRFYIITPGPEQVLRSTKHPDYKKALNSASYAIPDGMGLIQAIKYLSLPSPRLKPIKYVVDFLNGLRIGLATFTNPNWLTKDIKPIKGRQFFWDLIRLADKNSWKVFLLGGEHGEGSASKVEIEKKYKSVKIETFEGPRLGPDATPVSQVDIRLQKDAIDKINKFNPQILFVAFGEGNPKQELWIYKNIKKLKVNCVMAVGGTFRYVAGSSKLPPKWMEGWGEWLWRLVTEPKRFKRIFNAFPIFPIKVFLSKISS